MPLKKSEKFDGERKHQSTCISQPPQIDIIRISTRAPESLDHRLALVVLVLRYRLALNSPGEMHCNIH